MAILTQIALVIASAGQGWAASGRRDGPRTTLESVSWQGQPARGHSGAPQISANGRYVVFTSAASNLVPGDTNHSSDVFVRDRQTGSVEMISVSTNGAIGDDESDWGAISGDGRYVAFLSEASNLVPGFWGRRSVFYRDRVLGTTIPASVSLSGGVPNSWSGNPSVSLDGRYVTFYSNGSDLIPNDTNNVIDVFVRDMVLGVTERESVSSSQEEATELSYPSANRGAISDNGRLLAFISSANNLVVGDDRGRDAFVRDRVAGTTRRISEIDGVRMDGASDEVVISHDGSTAVIVQNREAIRSDQLQTGVVNPNSDVFVVSLATNEVRQISHGDLFPSALANDWVSVSGDGRFVAYEALSPVLTVADDKTNKDVYVYDRRSERTSVASVSSEGLPAIGGAALPSLSYDGRLVAFVSASPVLSKRDRNVSADVFVRDRGPARCDADGRAEGDMSRVLAGLGRPGLACRFADEGL